MNAIVRFAAACLAGCLIGLCPALHVGAQPYQIQRLWQTTTFNEVRVRAPVSAVASPRSVEVYLGDAATVGRLRLRINDLPSDASVQVFDRNGDRRDLITRTGEVTTREVPGNVIRMTLSWRHSPERIDVRVVGVDRLLPRIRAQVGRPNLAVPGDLRVRSLPLQPDTPAMIVLDGAAVHLDVANAAGDVVDVYLDRSASVRWDLSTWPSSRGTAGTPLLLMTQFDQRPALAMAGSAQTADAGRVYLTIAPDANAQPTLATVVASRRAPRMKLSFPSPEVWQFGSVIFGVDQDPAPGTAGPAGGSLDCKNYRGERGVMMLSPVVISLPFGASITIPPPPPGFALPRIPVCYDGHTGSDFVIVGGPLAQNAGVPVSAAAPGVVIATGDGHYDRCFMQPMPGPSPAFGVRCDGGPLLANFVAVKQDDGLLAYYFHLRDGSVCVEPGQRIVCGETIGMVGSSGISALPHLHFELRQDNRRGPFSSDPDPNSAPAATLELSNPTNTVKVGDAMTVVDPFQERLWRAWGDQLPKYECE